MDLSVLKRYNVFESNFQAFHCQLDFPIEAIHLRQFREALLTCNSQIYESAVISSVLVRENCEFLTLQ